MWNKLKISVFFYYHIISYIYHFMRITFLYHSLKYVVCVFRCWCSLKFGSNYIKWSCKFCSFTTCNQKTHTCSLLLWHMQKRFFLIVVSWLFFGMGPYTNPTPLTSLTHSHKIFKGNICSWLIVVSWLLIALLFKKYIWTVSLISVIFR